MCRRRMSFWRLRGALRESDCRESEIEAAGVFISDELRRRQTKLDAGLTLSKLVTKLEAGSSMLDMKLDSGKRPGLETREKFFIQDPESRI